MVDATSGGKNAVGLAVAATSLYEFVNRPADLFPSPPPSPSASNRKAHRYVVAVGFGSLLHLIHTFCTDGGTIIAWVWTGFPVTGPQLYPHGAYLLGALALGMCIPDAWPATGVLSAFVLYRFPDWSGFVGGLGLAFYLTSTLPRYLTAASIDTALVVGIGALIYCVYDVLSVVTTAYAFVPFGHLLRERTDLVLATSMFWTVAGSFCATPAAAPRHTSNKRIKLIERATLAFAALMAVAAALRPSPEKTPVPNVPEHRIFTAGIWTVSHGDIPS